jgi:Na+-transporting methylmalonyl-CoA/oxaloacetate decarboxylase gamma subunit
MGIIAILLILTLIYLIIGIAALVYDFKDARRKDRESKAAKVY